jgi:hypothetical protein
MKIDTCKLRAANEFRARGDVRYYLNGIRINKNYIEATNGHTAIRMKSGIRTRLDVIVDFKGKIPAAAIKTKLEFSKGKNTAYHYDGFEQCIAVQLFDIQDGKFPDFNRVIPESYELADKHPSLQAKYMAQIDKAFKKEKFVSVRTLHNANEKVVFGLGGLLNEIYGEPIIVMMGIKE